VLKFTLKSTQPEPLMEQVSGLLRELSAEAVVQ